MKPAPNPFRILALALDVTAAPAQDVPMGYKRNELGVIPEDWEAKRLGELAAFRNGPFGSALHKADYIDGGIPLINLNQTVLSGLQIQCPPTAGQRAIADALSDVDGLRGALETLIAKKRAIKQAAMPQLLTGNIPRI